MSNRVFKLGLGFLCVTAAVSQSAVPNRENLDRMARQQAAELVKSMSVDEKIRLVEMNNRSIDRLNIPAHHLWNEALHGVACRGKATQFPVPLSMASSWNDHHDSVIEG